MLGLDRELRVANVDVHVLVEHWASVRAVS
jgi:hypothetical protein